MIETYKQEAKLFLEGYSIDILRNIARLISVAQPHSLPKVKLIDNIIETLCGQFVPNNKWRPTRMGHALYEKCEIILEQLMSILNIDNSLIIKAIKLRHQKVSLNPKKQESLALTFTQYVSGMLSLCEGQSELEIMTRIMLELSMVKGSQRSRNAI